MAPTADESIPFERASAEQAEAYERLAAALNAVKVGIHQLESARDLLNREPPAREVAIAITEFEGGELRVEKALRVLTSSVVFPPVPQPTVTGGGYDQEKSA